LLALAAVPNLHAQRAESRRLWLAALDQKAEFAVDSSLTLLRAAVRADTTFLPPLRDYLDEMRDAGRLGQLRREIPEPPASATVLTQCRWGMTRGAFGGSWTAIRTFLHKLDALTDPSGCKAALIAYHSALDPPEQRLRLFRDALASQAESWVAWSAYADILNTLGRRDEAVRALLEGLNRSQHPVHTLALQLRLVDQYEAMGDTAAAQRRFAAIGTSVARDGRPYLRWIYLRRPLADAQNAGNDVRSDSLVGVQVALARRARADPFEYLTLVGWGSWLRDVSNDPKKAIAPLTRAVVLAERMRSSEFSTSAYMERGRAFARLGDFRRAEQDLQRSLTATAPDEWARLAEIRHHLAHVYEGQGRWPDAVREMDLYGRNAWHVREGSAEYMMSFRDAGTIRWKAGWHAAAQKSFEEMVRIIEERDANHFYAGEYYERIGDFARAASYFDRGARSVHSGELHLNLAGLTRMYQALGLKDSARATATRHDGLTQYSDSRLLPSALFADGQVAEALALARTNVAEREAKGFPQLTTSARLQLARLLLDAGRASDANREAARAERLAESSNLTEEVIDAIHIQGVAQLREGSQSSIATLLRARSLVQAHPVAAAELKVELALGDAYLAFGQDAASLAAYGRAATASQRVTASFESALDRARNRDQRIAPFDGALRVLLAMPASSSRSQQVYAWSARKKSAVWSESRGGGDSTKADARLSNLQRRLDDRTAVLDYIAIDSIVFAHVITAREVRVLKLPLSVAATADLVQRLRRPLVAVDAGQLDLARAPFDLRLAQQLYRGLFAPIESFLGDAQHIIMVPDGPLHGVPFSALPRALGEGEPGANAYHAASYVIDRYTVTLAVSPAFADARRSRGSPADARVLVVRGAVPGGEREVASIVGAWPARRVTSLSGERATEAALRRRVAATSVIHFAVHARADEGDPLASYLELARDSSDDGFLHVTEVADLKFRGDLVVLTGCETLPGRVFAGTGPFGIANSFIAAGARNVIATHWPVGESAAELSQDLHRALARGVEPSEALRAAQLALRRDPARAHPFYWGGYVLVAGTAPQPR